MRVSSLGPIIVSLLSLSLMACNTIEHQSDTIAKVQLPAVVKGRTALKAVWSNHSGAGVGKSDVPLGLGIASSTVVVADYQGNLYALDRMSGVRLWSVKTKAVLSAGPSIVDNQIMLGTEEGKVLSYQLSNGALIWESSVESPVFAAMRGNHKTVFVHTLADGVVALDLENGQKRWSYAAISTTPALILRRSAAPVLYQDIVLVGLSNGQLLALDASTGMVLWQKEMASPKGRLETQRMIDLSADPLLQGGILYTVGYQGNITALKANSGDLLWEQPLSSYAGISVSDRTLIVPDYRGVMHALDAITGKQRWKQSGLVGRRLTKPLCVGTMVLVGDDEGFLHWLDLETGHYLGRYVIDTRGIEAPIVLREGLVYVLGKSGKVVAFKEDFFHRPSPPASRDPLP